MPDVYATRGDVFKYGLPRGLLANPGRLCASALASTDRFELDGHGFETDTVILFRVEAGGTLPAPIVAGTSYFAKRVNESIFQVSLTAGGAAIDLTTEGTAVVVTTPLPFDELLEYYSRFVDDYLPAHGVPLDSPYPPTIVGIVAKLTAKELQRICNQSSEAMTEELADAKEQIKRWGEAHPLRDARATGPANLAYSESAPPQSSRDWGGGTLP